MPQLSSHPRRLARLARNAQIERLSKLSIFYNPTFKTSRDQVASTDSAHFSWAIFIIGILHCLVWSLGVSESYSRDFFARQQFSLRAGAALGHGAFSEEDYQSFHRFVVEAREQVDAFIRQSTQFQKQHDRICSRRNHAIQRLEQNNPSVSTIRACGLTGLFADSDEEANGDHLVY
jgi:hypothetical protein